MLDETIEEVIRTVEGAFEMPYGMITDMTNRAGDVPLARHLACYIVRKRTLARFSWKKISASFGSTDHSMAMHGFNRISTTLRGQGSAAERAKLVLLLRKIAPDLL